MKIKLIKDTMCAGDMHELLHYPRPWFKPKPELLAGTILEVKEVWSNFYGRYFRCMHENGTYDISVKNAEIIK